MKNKTDKGGETAKAGVFEKFREDWQRLYTADPSITLAAMKVAVALMWHLNRRTRRAYPGILTLAKLTGLHRATVIRAIKWLEEHGYLSVIRAKNGKRWLPNQYLPQHPDPGGSRKLVRLGSRTTMPLGSRKLVRPEPLIEPLIEHSVSKDTAPPSGGGDRSVNGTQESKVGSEASGSREDKNLSSSEVPLELTDLTAECYRLAREACGERGASLASRALKQDSAETVLAVIREANETGDDLAHALWVAAKDGVLCEPLPATLRGKRDKSRPMPNGPHNP